jgi:hypothetical protein
MAASSPSRSWADFITDTNGKRPDPDCLIPDDSAESRAPKPSTITSPSIRPLAMSKREPAPFGSTEPQVSPASSNALRRPEFDDIELLVGTGYARGARQA